MPGHCLQGYSAVWKQLFFPLQHSKAEDHLNSPSPSLAGDRKAPAVLEMRQMLMELRF